MTMRILSMAPTDGKKKETEGKIFIYTCADIYILQRILMRHFRYL
jgi:hypothetical protein